MNKKSISRRDFLIELAETGGAGALYGAMVTMGLMATPKAYAGPPELPAGSGKGKKIVIIGAGLAGLVAAYELSKAGYHCIVLEARGRCGGRSKTVRAGDKIYENDSVQTCKFDSGKEMYLNLGPARFPADHSALIGYCQKLGIELQMINNHNPFAYLHDDAAFAGKPLQIREVATNSRGFISELLAKVISKNALDQQFSKDDKEKMLMLLKAYGDLNDIFLYKGSDRSGYAKGGRVKLGVKKAPIDLSELLKSDFWHYKMNWGEILGQGPMMLQPVGGMDMIIKGFEKQVGHLVIKHAVVKKIINTTKGVIVVYDDKKEQKKIHGDFCINSIPIPALKNIETNFSAEFNRAMHAVPYLNYAKIGFQAKRRFWEQDCNIYGGISWTNQDITQIWYPSSGFNSQKGIVLGAYIFDNKISEKIGNLTPSQRLILAKQQGQKIHPTYSDDVEHGVSCAWHKVPYSLGAMTISAEHLIPILEKPQGQTYMAGADFSYLGHWQEGAVLSSHHVIKRIHQRVQKK